VRTRVARVALGTALAVLGLAAGARRAPAQGVVGGPVPITLNVNQSSSLSVTIQSGAIQSLNSASLSNAITPFPTPVQILTQWDFRPNQVTSLSLVAFFATPATALSGPTGSIPSSRIQGQISSSTGPAAPLTTTWTAFTGSGIGANGVAGGSLSLWNFTVVNNSAANRKNQQLNRLDLRLNLTGFTLPTGTFTGTLVVRAMAL
jgi:hypothetical protein